MSTAPQRPTKKVSEILIAAVSFVGRLDVGEKLTGTPLVDEVTTNDLTLSNKQISTSALTINDSNVAIGHAVQFKVSVGVAGTTYNIRVTAQTASVPPQTVIGLIVLEVISD